MSDDTKKPGFMVDSEELNARLRLHKNNAALVAGVEPAGMPPGIDYFDEPNMADEVAMPTLERLTKLAQESRDLEVQITAATVALEELKGKNDKITRRLIPGIMEELALSEFKMLDGAVVSIKESVNASISAENKPAAHAWLAEHNYDGIIKTKVLSEFGKGEMERAQAAMEALTAIGIAATLDQSVHAMTLKSFVKERLEAGESIPVDLFGIYDFKEAKIKLPKKKK